jgi:hypothetical protein
MPVMMIGMQVGVHRGVFRDIYLCRGMEYTWYGCM